jgi:HrpA-like RNA helicase
LIYYWYRYTVNFLVLFRTRLENVVLKVKVLGCKELSEFLSQLLDPPSQLAVDLAVQALKDIGALDAEGKLGSW